MTPTRIRRSRTRMASVFRSKLPTTMLPTRMVTSICRVITIRTTTRSVTSIVAVSVAVGVGVEATSAGI